MSESFPSRELDKFIVRLPDGLRDRIKRSADENGRSMNAEVVQLLEQAYPEDEPVEDIIDAIEIALRVVEHSGSKAVGAHLVEELKNLADRLAREGHFEGHNVPPKHIKAKGIIKATAATAATSKRKVNLD